MRDVPTGPVRVVFLEDERGLAEATLEALTNRGILVIGLAETVEAAVGLVARERPEVVVANVRLLGALALDLPAALGSAGPPVLWFSGHLERYRDAAARAGGVGYVSKSESMDDLAAAIRRTAAGKETWTPDDLRAKRSAPKPPTNREREVLAGVAAGRPNKEIADDLGITERGVESNLRRMYDRYSTSNRSELLDLAQRSGWL